MVSAGEILFDGVLPTGVIFHLPRSASKKRSTGLLAREELAKSSSKSVAQNGALDGEAVEFFRREKNMGRALLAESAAATSSFLPKTLSVTGIRRSKEPKLAAFVKRALEDALYPRVQAMVPKESCNPIAPLA